MTGRTMRRMLVVAEMVVRDVVRRRAVTALLFAVPLAFYFAQQAKLGQSIRLASLGLAWAVATLALFAGSAGRRIDPRLRLAGFRARDLWAGRLVGLLALGWVMGAAYFALIVAHRSPWRAESIALELALTVAVAAGFGLFVGELVPGELEGTLIVIAVVGVQMVMNPFDAPAKALPFWSTRELLTYAVDQTGTGFLARGLAHGLAVLALLLAATAWLAARRLRLSGGPLPARHRARA